jgi:GTPase SAR1 family protein
MITCSCIRMASAVTVVVGLLFAGHRLRADEPTHGQGMPTSRSFHMGFTTTWTTDFATRAGEPPEAVERMHKIATEHADMIAYHREAYDIPWPESLAVRPRPETESTLRKSRLKTGPKVYLAVTPLSFPSRNALAPYWGKQETAESRSVWERQNFDDPKIIAAYTDYCRRMIREFEPDYMAYGIEVNTLAGSNPTGFRKFLVMTKQVYEVLKRENPDLPIFLTFQIDGYHHDKEKQSTIIRQLLPYTDYMAVSCYPYMRGYTPDNLPKDWFSEVAELAPSKPFAIAEAGYPSEDVVGKLVGDKDVRVRANTQWQARYARFILEETNRLNGKFVVWFFFHDYDAFLDRFRGEELKKVQFLRWWRDNGMVDADGNPREALGIWDEWLKLPLR